MKLNSRVPMQPTPFREKKERSTKIIFFSCEGPVTEEAYFNILSEKIFVNIANKICLVSARRDFLAIPRNERTQEQWNEQNKSSPKYVLERMENFKKDNEQKYEFDKHPEDEFWLVMDVDKNSADNKIEEFKRVIQESMTKKIQCAITNPCFEFWLYLHHFEVEEEDNQYANKAGGEYFRKKMSDVGIHMSGNDHKLPKSDDYTIDNVRLAVKRAKELHTNTSERWPMQLGSHVYCLVDKFYQLQNE